MATIAAGQDVLTIINVFTVEPERAQELVDVLIRNTEEVISRHPGHMSTSLHLGRNGTRVANYSQWRSREDFDSMLDDPAAQAGMQAVRRLATPDAHHYEVVWCHPAG